jgi:hypothetical protein
MYAFCGDDEQHMRCGNDKVCMGFVVMITYWFCNDDEPCVGFVLIITYWFCGDDKPCMGFVMMINIVWVLR